MRPIVKAILAIAVINTIFGVCNIFIMPPEYKIYGNITILLVLAIQLVLCSIVIHSPDKDSK